MPYNCLQCLPSSVQTCHPLADIQMKWIWLYALLCTYRLNWARRTSWGWWDEWDDTALQTRDSKFKPWRSEAEHATYRSRRSPTILSFTSGWGRNIFVVFFKPPRPVNEQPSTSVKGSGANHYPRAAAQQIYKFIDQRMLYRGKLVLKHWKELNVSLLPNDEKTCIQSLIHNWKSYSFCVHVSTIHTVTSRDVWRPWHILFNRDL